ncbi:hypothetical protein [Syntrophotalea acetylenica]|uniref:hypothetical protein n=1 Tax=Syntrophotalea acetylenica TaxID=29542 RepID=UPI0011AB4D1D|nr:hypothetical protein [Syntrophotalea acetylenica]
MTTFNLQANLKLKNANCIHRAADKPKKCDKKVSKVDYQQARQSTTATGPNDLQQEVLQITGAAGHHPDQKGGNR